MEWFEALILGLLQGLTEYLPVSSSGHLAIGSALFGIQGETIGNRDGTSSVSEQRNSVSHTYCRRYCSNHGQDYYF